LGIVGGLGIELQGEFEFATPMGAGGAESLQVGRYSESVGGIDEQGPAMGREKVIQSVGGALKLHGGKIIRTLSNP
jgi:hypothetical protein